MENLDTFLANLKKAIRDNETVTIGGGEFSPVELFKVWEAIATLKAEAEEHQ